MKPKNIDRHNQCECEIRWKQFKNKNDATPGLFCSFHDVFLDWLRYEDAIVLIDNGTKEAPYLERKKPKKKNNKTKYYQKAKIRAKKIIGYDRQTSNH